MMDMLIALYPTLKALWVVCFLLVFLAMLVLVMRPSRKRDFEAAARIPLRDDSV
jgi:cbb3-type cytochrome oxidase subunit 3